MSNLSNSINMNDVIEQIRENELTPDLQMIAEICGMDSVRQLIKNMSGLNFYIPKLSRFESFIERYMKQEPGKSIKQLAKELRVSEQFLKTIERRILKIKKK